MNKHDRDSVLNHLDAVADELQEHADAIGHEGTLAMRMLCMHIGHSVRLLRTCSASRAETKHRSERIEELTP